MTPVDDCEAWSTGVLPVRTEGSVTPVDLNERSFLLLKIHEKIKSQRVKFTSYGRNTFSSYSNYVLKGLKLKRSSQ